MPQWLVLLLSVPSVSALIGWVTNWQAVKMIFWPEVRLGWGLLSWQGIIFHHADKFATNLGRVAQQSLLTGAEVVAKLDRPAIEAVIDEQLAARTRGLVERIAERLVPGGWDKLAEPMRTMVIATVTQKSRAMAKELVEEMAPALAEELDIAAVVRGQLSGPHVRRLARLTHEIGRKEFRFIEWSGGVFGLVIGVGQLAVWEAMQIWWVMPIFGVIVGLVTNYLAIQMIFRPLERTRYLGVPYQGLFPKRQAEIAADYGRTTAAEIITPTTLLDFLLESPRKQRLLARLEAAIGARIDRELAPVRGSLPLAPSDAQISEVKEMVVADLLAAAASLRAGLEEQMSKTLGVREIVESRLAALPKPEFERLLRGVFQEDELTLIIVGGVLGGGVGLLQAALVLM